MEKSSNLVSLGGLRHRTHLYFQAPGGQCLRLVGIDEDLSFYGGVGAGPDVAKAKEAVIAQDSGVVQGRNTKTKYLKS